MRYSSCPSRAAALRAVESTDCKPITEHSTSLERMPYNKQNDSAGSIALPNRFTPSRSLSGAAKATNPWREEVEHAFHDAVVFWKQNHHQGCMQGTSIKIWKGQEDSNGRFRRSIVLTRATNKRCPMTPREWSCSSLMGTVRVNCALIENDFTQGPYPTSLSRFPRVAFPVLCCFLACR